MSVPFTSLVSGGNAQSLAMANELVLAYSERRQVIGQSAVSSLVAGDNAQDKTLWLAMQTWCEANCTSFIDHVNGPLNPEMTAFLYFTLETWRAAAGLNADGFRRSVDGTTMLYGNIQAGDVRGLWCFEDLQKGFSALRWSDPVAGTIHCITKSGNGSSYEALYLAKQNAIANLETVEVFEGDFPIFFSFEDWLMWMAERGIQWYGLTEAEHWEDPSQYNAFTNYSLSTFDFSGNTDQVILGWAYPFEEGYFSSYGSGFGEGGTIIPLEPTFPLCVPNAGTWGALLDHYYGWNFLPACRFTAKNFTNQNA